MFRDSFGYIKIAVLENCVLIKKFSGARLLSWALLHGTECPVGCLKCERGAGGRVLKARGAPQEGLRVWLFQVLESRVFWHQGWAQSKLVETHQYAGGLKCLKAGRWEQTCRRDQLEILIKTWWEASSFIHSFKTHTVNTYYVPNTVLGLVI